MKSCLLLAQILCVLVGLTCAAAETRSSEAASATDSAAANSNGVPIERLVATVAKKTGKQFLLDPRVHTNVVLVGQEPSEITYPQLLTILDVYGYATVEEAGYVRVAPDANIRSEPIPTITSKDARAASEYVTQIIPVKNISAVELVPILRPMLPQQAQLSALPSANTLIVVDRFANVRRIEALVRSLDTPENKPREGDPRKEP
jgi:general secretion pathway protein D